MKTAYELAMERLNRDTPSVNLSAEQKARLAELDSKYAARIAEREIAVQGDLDHALASGDVEKADEVRRVLASERKSLQAELEQKKDEIRSGNSGRSSGA